MTDGESCLDQLGGHAIGYRHPWTLALSVFAPPPQWRSRPATVRRYTPRGRQLRGRVMARRVHVRRDPEPVRNILQSTSKHIPCSIEPPQHRTQTAHVCPWRWAGTRYTARLD